MKVTVEWRLASISGNIFDLSRLGEVPLELDLCWLGGRIDSADKDLKVFLLGEQKCPSGYAPFFVHNSALAYRLGETTVFRIPVRRYTMTGSPLCENYALLPELFKLLRQAMSNSDVVFFEGIQTSSPFSRLLTSKTPVCDFFYVVPHGPAYTRRLIELNSGAQFEDYLRTLGSKTREDVRRTRKNFPLKAGGAVTLIRYTQPEQAHELAAALAQVSRKTYQYHLLDLGLENTSEHVAYLSKTAANGWLRAYVLKIGDTPVAFGLGYRDSHTYYGHHIGYDPSLSKLQPGIYLHTEVMADLLADGIFRFDFLPGDSLYKQRMSNKSREERHYYLIPRGWPGTAYAAMLISMNFISEVIGRWLNKTGLKERVKRQVRILAVWRSSRRP